MEKNVNEQILQEMTQLLEKMAVESFVPVITDTATDGENTEAVLLNLKGLNARYDKQEAMVHVRALMQKYNIQIDELLEQIKY